MSRFWGNFVFNAVVRAVLINIVNYPTSLRNVLYLLGPPAPTGTPIQAIAPRPPAPQTSDPQTDILACNWIKTHYEPVPDSLVTRMEMYGHYLNMSSKTGAKSVANANSFVNCVR